MIARPHPTLNKNVWRKGLRSSRKTSLKCCQRNAWYMALKVLKIFILLENQLGADIHTILLTIIAWSLRTFELTRPKFT